MALVLLDCATPSLVTITLNDPDNLNAMGEDMAEEFSAIVRQLKPQAAKIRSIILTGSGRAFSAGGRLEMLDKKRSLSGEENRLKMLDFYHSFLELTALDIPLIAAINGHAIGAGLCVASACDIRVVAKEAKLGFTFTKLGLHPGMGATYFLPRVIGTAAATELLITGRLVDAMEAQRLGLASRVVPAAEVLSEAKKVAQEIAECGPQAVRQVLQNLRAGPHSLEGALQREALAQSINYASAEFAEGLKATMEKRKPNF